ncbi:unnamed protein product [Zymoseptoria tritici ST99CH_1E4]|uniref:Ca2+-modulated nonselective cation channel polycystin n=1 Tax=Zymoseptoria tritici ST99CH_1E4 TaxID=1276532 RepID=A0A2H1GZZ3_ZYMTR|nr:unnamed protein product [Zymoseptoria tritici ST99CH_1E4]
MRWFSAALQVLSVAALPTLPSGSGEANITPPPPTTTTPAPRADLVYFDVDTSRAVFNLASHELTSPLVFDVQLHQVEDPLTSNLTINGQQLSVDVLDLLNDDLESDQPGKDPIQSPPRLNINLAITDRSGASQFMNVAVVGFASLRPQATYDHIQAEPEHHLRIDITAVDHPSDSWGFELQSRPLLPGGGLFKFIQLSSGDQDPVESMYHSHSILDPTPLAHLSDLPKSVHDDYNVADEIESLILLEAEAGHLDTEIAARKQAIAKCLKNHRDQVTLKHLLRECDGLTCAAKVVAQRICDNIGILTEPAFQYTQVEAHSSPQQKLIHFDDDDDSSTDSSEETLPTTHTAANSKTLQSSTHHLSAFSRTAPTIIVTPQSLLLKVLALLASALGLAALVSYLRFKFQSPRTQVDRLAAKEERRTARAYRRAARRAEMRRRWGNFLDALNCCKAGRGKGTTYADFHDSGRRMENYDEKRRLILQDAFLEQDMSTHAKGEVMEAEIRELRHANQIVSALVHNAPVRGPTRAHVPQGAVAGWVGDAETGWVQTPMATGRSRASTEGTLPSYSSEVLPDYRSRYTRTTAASSSVRSDSVIAASSTPSSVFGLEPSAEGEEASASRSGAGTNTAGSGTGSGTGSGSGTQTRSQSPMSGTSGRTQTSGFTALSSVVDVESGYRASGETMRTIAMRVE